MCLKKRRGGGGGEKKKSIVFIRVFVPRTSAGIACMFMRINMFFTFYHGIYCVPISFQIADFGLANYFSFDNSLRTFCGSPLYASPEIVNGKPYHGPEVSVCLRCRVDTLLDKIDIK